MDISQFSDDNFDAKAWINDILGNPNKEPKENYAVSLVMKLQLYVQQINNALEDTSRDVLQSLPKILRDTKILKDEGLLLKEKMAYVRNEIEQVERDTGSSLHTIIKLDNLKNQLNEAKQSLHESDNWTILVNDLEEIFDSKNIDKISNKILGMQQSLKMLVNVYNYEDRKLQLEGLKNRLEAIASPNIVQAFNTSNTDQALIYVRIFSSINRLPQLLKYYHKCQKDILLKKWTNQLEVEQDESVIQWIHNFYNMLLSNWHSQYKWFHQVFPGQPVVDHLAELYADVLNSLEPSFGTCIDASLKQVSEKLNFLHEVKQVMKEFHFNIINIMKQTQGKTDTKKQFLLLQAVYNPFIPYVKNYAAYEQATLAKKLLDINCIKEELPDTIQALGFSISSVIAIAEEAKVRCQELTENCGFCGLLTAYRAFFLNYIDQYKVALRQIERNRKYTEDWTTFQLCLSLLQNAGDVLLKLHHLEQGLTSHILEMNQQKDEEVDYKNLLLDASDRKELSSLIKCVREGTKLSVLDKVITEFNKLCSDIHHVTYQVVLAPIETHLNTIQKNKTWTINDNSMYNSELPDYSFSPQEYITEIGQYLMTLPQHLEPFFFKDNPSLSYALKTVDEEYNSAIDVEGALADIFLKMIARGVCLKFADNILSICELSPGASRQLSHDIGYLNNVFQDLGLTLSDNLQQISLLLKLPSEQYLSQSVGCSARYVAAIRQMRNITSN